jgi:hypothetical protein
VTRSRTLALAAAAVLLHALAREADRGLGLVLRAEVEPAGLLSEVARAAASDGAAALLRVGPWLLAGAGLWLVSRGDARLFAPLLLRPVLTLLALAAVAVRPAYPYGFTLPVALTQDWGIGQDVAALAAMLALRLPAPRLPAPRAGEVFLLSFLVYAALVPGWAWQWEGHPGNEPKYLRQAVALGHGLTFDAEGVSAAMEDLTVEPLATTVPRAARVLARESWAMASAVLRGEAGREAIRATRITRQTIRGKDGGVYYVLAPGPSLMLAPALRADRALNLARGARDRVAASVLLWCATAALLVTALFLLVRDATSRAGLAAALAFGFALVPPFLFYFFQFYPEMVGALVLALAFRTLALRPEGLLRHPWWFAWMLATLPWLHQKFLPVWLALVATAAWVGLSSRATLAAENRPLSRRAWLAGLLVPTALGLYLTALYNFAITGSVRPDALFLAWGPGGVTSARVGQGILGLLLDARYGILPYVPVLMLAAGGLVLGGGRRFAVVMPAAAVYYLTVASADNWAGAVCNLGRYVMPVLPLAVALVAIAIDRAPRRGVVALASILAAWTGLVAVALWRDPHAANDSALLLAKSAIADGNQYVPNLFIRRWSDGAPGLLARIAAWAVALVALAAWFRRVARGGEDRPAGRSPVAVLAGVAAFVLVAAFALERWPGPRTAPRFPGALPHPGGTLFLDGPAQVRGDEAVIGPGAVLLVLRAPSAPPSITVTLGGSDGVLRAGGLPPLVLRPTGALVRLPLVPYHQVRGRDGRAVAFARTTLDLDGEAVLRAEMEPGGGGER